MNDSQKNLLSFLGCLLLIIFLVFLIFNSRVMSVGKAHTVTVQQAAAMEDVDCVIVLGCQVREDGSLSDMLRDRLDRALELYEQGAAPKLLMSGDHGQTNYNEVGAMKAYAIEQGVPSGDVFMDHAGFSTYETVYRAKEVFQAQKVLIVTQNYHLQRALYIAEKLGLEAYGVSADLHTYQNQWSRELREVLARCKDVAKCAIQPKPTYLGEPIPISGNGDLTND